jgi:hypothetical protein
MWSLYENQKYLEPLVFSNGKSQEDIVKEVIDAANQGFNIIFIRGMCGTGKSAIALNLARHFGRTSIVVPIKSLQEQYTQDYSEKKYVKKKDSEEHLDIRSLVGRPNFKCRFLEEFGVKEDYQKRIRETNAKLSDIFSGVRKKPEKEQDDTCNNDFIPCKIEIKEKNIDRIKDFIRQNPAVKIKDFSSINEVKRMTIAPICPYWCPILSDTYEIKKFKDVRKIKYSGLNGKGFIIYQRRKGCPYYDQYEAYAESDVLIFNSLKYKIETLMDRKPATAIEIIDECDDFLDSFANQEQLNINRLLYALNMIFPEDAKMKSALDKLIDITNTIKISKKFKEPSKDISPVKGTLMEELLETVLDNSLTYSVEVDESSYLFHLDKVARTFQEFLDETYFSVEHKEGGIIIHLVTTNLEKKFKELLEKNKIIVMMSGTLHSEPVLRNIFGIEKFKIIDAEIHHQGELIKCKHGYEMDCKYENFQSQRITRKEYLLALSKTISCAKRPVLVHVNSFSDLPTSAEKETFHLDNLPAQNELLSAQKEDPLGKKIIDFKKGRTDILFTTKCNRGIDFPGETCNSIVITRFPYPNISSLFWRILKKTRPAHYMSFYMDKARRELLQKIYRGLRSKNDRIYLLSPDIRVLESNIA